MKVVAKTNFNLNGVFYEKGDEIKNATKEMATKLNERGFIEPLTPKQLQNFDKEDTKKFNIKED